MTEKTKKRFREKTLFHTEQQFLKERIIAAAGDYLSGRRPLPICRSKVSSDRIG